MTKIIKMLGVFGLALLAIMVERFAVDQQYYKQQPVNNISVVQEGVQVGSDSNFSITDKGVITSYTGDSAQVVIPATINSIVPVAIGNSAFSKNLTITSVHMPASITKLNFEAFNGCANLQSIDVSNITQFGRSVFGDCSSLTTIFSNNSGAFNNSVIEIPSYCFYNCKSLTNAIDFNNVLNILDGAFSGCKSLSSVDLSGVKTIGRRAFYGCEALTSINISQVTEIGEYAFSKCTNLDELAIDYSGNMFNNALTSLPKYCFYDTTLTRVLNLNNITTIGEYAFAKTLMGSIDISNITSLGKGTFEDCKLLTNIDANNDGNFSSQLKSIPSYCFCRCYRLTGNFELGNVASLEWGAFQEAGITGVDLSKVDNMKAKAFYQCSNLTTIDFKNDGDFNDGLLEIPTACFYECTALTGEIDLNCVKTVGKEAFYLTDITAINLSSVNEVQPKAFYKCSQLATFNIDSNGYMFGPNLKLIPFQCFYECFSLSGNIDLRNVTAVADGAFYRTSITRIDLSKVTSIGYEVFYECMQLQTIDSKNNGVFHSSLREIGDYTFFDCRALTGVIDFNKVEDVGASAFYNTKITGVEMSSVKQLIEDVLMYGVFEKCTEIETLDYKNNGIFNDELTEIPTSCFYYNSKLTGELDLNNVVKVASFAFTQAKFTTVIAPKVKTIGQDAFKGSDNIYLGKEYNYSAGKMIDSTKHATIYGYNKTGADEYSKQNNCQFSALDSLAIIAGLKKTAEGLTIEAVGHRIKYQWYMSYSADLTPETATIISGATSSVLNVDDYRAGKFYLVQITDWLGESVTAVSTVQIFTFKIQVNYNAKGGIVECVNNLNKIEYGATRTLYIVPQDGYELGKITLNGQEVALTDGQLVIDNIVYDQVLDIEFVGGEEGGSATMLYIILGLIGGAFIICMFLWKWAFKRRTFE